MTTPKNEMMKVALTEAKEAYDAGEVPVGAALFHKDGTLIASERNRVEELNDPTAHAEMLVIKKACTALETRYLDDYMLCVTLEPCAMCAQAISLARVGVLIFGAYDIKSGGTTNGARVFDQKTCHHKPELYDGILETESARLLQTFFKEKRGVDTV